MRHLRPFKIFEKSLLEAEEELRGFQSQSQLQAEVEDTLAAIEATEIALQTLFPLASEVNDLEKFIKQSHFAQELTERRLKAGELYDTQDDSTIVKLPMRYLMIYTRGSSDLDTPIYMLLQFKEASWSPVKLYYVQKDIKHFYDSLSTVLMTITKKDNPDKSWVYKSSNSGRNWVLQNQTDGTTTFKDDLSWDEVQELKKHSKIEVTFN